MKGRSRGKGAQQTVRRGPPRILGTAGREPHGVTGTTGATTPRDSPAMVRAGPRKLGPAQPRETHSRWCGRGSWDDPGRGRVRICCKGAPGRDRHREKARNINDSPRALRHDRSLCNRSGQPAAAAPPGRTAASPIATMTGTPTTGRARGGIRRGRRGPRRRPPGRSSTPRGALRIRKCSSSRRFRVQNAHLECKMHISARKRAGHGRHRPRRRSRPGAFPVTRRERVTEPFSPGRPPDWPGSA